MKSIVYFSTWKLVEFSMFLPSLNSNIKRNNILWNTNESYPDESFCTHISTRSEIVNAYLRFTDKLTKRGRKYLSPQSKRERLSFSRFSWRLFLGSRNNVRARLISILKEIFRTRSPFKPPDFTSSFSYFSYVYTESDLSSFYFYLNVFFFVSKRFFYLIQMKCWIIIRERFADSALLHAGFFFIRDQIKCVINHNLCIWI